MKSREMVPFLEYTAYQMRYWSVVMTTEAGSGHMTSALSAADIVATLFFYTMRYNPANFEYSNNDRFILSKGHAVPILYAVWKEVGVLTQEDLLRYRTFDSPLEGHPTPRFAYTEAATGSLGMGLSIGLGEALNARMQKLDYRTFVLMGDSEVSEGSIWEAVQLAAYYKTNNLIGIIDVNRLGQSTQTMEGHDIGRFQGIFEAFGWHVITVDGHDIPALMDAFDQACVQKEKPVMVLAKTYKGYGLDVVQDKPDFHGKVFGKKQLPELLAQLESRFAQAAAYDRSYDWQPHMPEQREPALLFAKEGTQLPEPTYAQTESVATRKAFGQALAQLGTVNSRVVSLDAEVKNSTYAQLFEEAHPERFIQSFVAEQNMVGMGIGLARRGNIPFVSTFGSFFSRAYDQVRMAAIGNAPLRLVGSHAGVSIGEDGPSQMALEDLALMRAIPDSVVLYPCDAVSTYKLVEQMAGRHEGISYLRTTRMATRVLYRNDQEFPIGGCNVLRQDSRGRDVACVIGAGVTLFEALKAYDLLALQEESTFISVIDLYSIKPLDLDTIIAVAISSGSRVITVEDHYPEGGIGQAVASALCNTDIVVQSLAVDKLPRSGTPQELLEFEGIDAPAIVRAVRQTLA